MLNQGFTELEWQFHNKMIDVVNEVTLNKGLDDHTLCAHLLIAWRMLESTENILNHVIEMRQDEDDGYRKSAEMMLKSVRHGRIKYQDECLNKVRSGHREAMFSIGNQPPPWKWQD